MSTNLPELPDAAEPDLPNNASDLETLDTFSVDEEPHDSGTVAFFLGVFGLIIGFCGTVSGLEGGGPNLLYFLGGVFMSLSAFLAIQTVRGGSKRGRTAAIFILALTFLPLATFWISLPGSLLEH